MMESFHRYRALCAADRWLVIEAAIFLTAARVGIAAVRFSVLRSALDRVPRVFTPKSSVQPPSGVARPGWAVAAVSRRLPFRATCLIESLAVDAMIRRRGYVSEIRFGVRPPDAGALAAHAWVECEGAVVFGSLDDYSVLSTRSAIDVSE